MPRLRAIRTRLSHPSVRGRALGVVAAALWCLAMALLLPQVPVGGVRASAASLPGPVSTSSPTGAAPTPDPTSAPASPTVAATATGSPQGTPTKGAETPTTAPTDTPDNSGGGNNGGGGGPTGPQPTRVNLGQPGVGSSDSGGGVSSFSPAQLTSNGLIIFTTLGCLLGVGGIAALAIGSISLVSDGWGPLLVALLLGNRRGRRRFARRRNSDGWGD